MDPNQVKTLIDVFRARTTEDPDRTAMLVKRGGAWAPIRWGEVARSVRGIAAGLAALGLKPGDRVAILSENRPEWAFADMGALSAGAADVPIYATNIPKQCEYVLRNSGAVACFVSTPAQFAKVEESWPACEDLRHVIAFDPLPEDKRTPGKVLQLDELVKRGEEKLKAEAGLLDEIAKQVKEDDLATLIYTSGTTGDPKGVMLTHRNFVSNVQAAIGEIGAGPEDVFLSFLPLSHSFERMAGYYTPVFAGSTIAYAESIERVRDNLPEVRPTVMCSVPRLYEKIYAGLNEKMRTEPGVKGKIGRWGLGIARQRAAASREGREPGGLFGLKYGIADKLVFSKVRERLGGRLRFFVSGGAPLAREIAEFFQSIGVIILEGYGLSETSPVITMNRPTEYRMGTVGKPIKGVEVKLAEDGEILARGPNIMRGYYKNEQATKEVLEADGWFHTGDIGEFDKDGFLRITDRKKDMMKTSGGKYIAPQTIENLFKTNRFIGECVVVANNRNYATALIVPKFEALEAWAKEQGLAFKDRTELCGMDAVKRVIQEQVAELNKGLGPWETVKKLRLIDRELSQETGELTPTLKVKRKVVNEKFKDLIEAMYSEAKEPQAAKA